MALNYIHLCIIVLVIDSIEHFIVPPIAFSEDYEVEFLSVDVDIIVFPESSLMMKLRKNSNLRNYNLYTSSYIPDPKDNKVPCDDSSSNVLPEVNCTGNKCPKNGHLLYNTNVVFDRNGAVIARYRKWNLYGEPKLNRTQKPELSYFHSDFNVTFGQFIGFDILFKTPAINLVKDNNITDILFSHQWFNELPYLTSNAIQSGYSFNYDLNLLGSGFNTPSTGSGGSGIYAGRDGVIKNIWPEKRINAMIIAKIPKIINGRREYLLDRFDAETIVFSSSEIPTINGSEPVPQMKFMGDNLKAYKTVILKEHTGIQNSTLCNNGFCCHFNIQTEYRKNLVRKKVKYYRYQLAVFNGVRSFEPDNTNGIEVCSIIACSDRRLISCKKRFRNNSKIVKAIIFHSIIISGKFENSQNVSRFPLSLTHNMNQLKVSDFEFTTNKFNATHNEIRYVLTKPHDDLMTFAIYGRNFTGDGLPKTLPPKKKGLNQYQNFFGDIYKPQMVMARSTNYDRTKMSLMLVLCGLYPPKFKQMGTPLLNWQPIPIKYFPAENDTLMNADLCPQLLLLNYFEINTNNISLDYFLFQASTPTSTYYVGAVVEYFPISDGTNASAIINENAKNFIKFINTAYENDVDIIVFPESSLTMKLRNNSNLRNYNLYTSSYIPDPKDNKVPCDDSSSNVLPEVNCTGDKCPENGHLLYNTNVVFDRNGAVIARYRKWNLYGEPKLNRTEKPELSYFHSDFNVTFGQFIGFDILFKTPAINLVEDNNITDILFSNHWFSELPYLTSNAIQSGYSFNYDLNLLGSGFNTPSTGSGGSGIYAGRDGVIENIWSEKRINAMVVAKIPKIINGRREYLLNRYDVKTIVFSSSQIPTINGSEPVPQMELIRNDLRAYKTLILKEHTGIQNTTLCNNGFCCHFNIQTEYRGNLARKKLKYYRHRLAVFNGVRSFVPGNTNGIEVCSIIACANHNPNSCRRRLKNNSKIVNPIIFHSIIISGKFKISQNVLRIPLSLTSNMNQLKADDFEFTTNKFNATHNEIQYVLTKPNNELMTFAIYGLNFTGDGLPKSLSNKI
ncbi:hypothetical protein PV328_003162 [Microctonus aethiopoides]|uniref:CN hydrolase domain-containing protein n=1 Tax=Microctonus aethiopoides TaxID=144406 RepID=A0AA39KKD3_9HYME|nr:hypothetical protein PV328_003162 [Microctonus aethiopoides]